CIFEHASGATIWTSTFSQVTSRALDVLEALEKDAKVFASWGIDFLKYDNCHNDGSPENKRYMASGWNDPDMLQVGNGDLTVDEQKSHFALWAALKAPLLLGFDIRNPPKDTLEIVLNPEIIAINQDPLGKSVHIAQSSRFFDVWTGPLTDGYVALLFNRAETATTITLDFAYHCKLEGEIHIRDLWERADKGKFTKSFSSKIPKHGIMILKLTGGIPIGTQNLGPANNHKTIIKHSTIAILNRLKTKCPHPSYRELSYSEELRGDDDYGWILGCTLAMIVLCVDLHHMIFWHPNAYQTSESDHPGTRHKLLMAVG
ncbi:14189_t:CDS:2, partial [Acaulospora colombiana]